MSERTQHLKARRQTLIDYLLMKAAAEDWHAVADAACDLRELESAIAALESIGH